MGAFYKPSGLAEQYADGGYALNIYLGCTHGCSYCYNKTSRFAKADYFENPAPRKEILKKVAKEAAEFAGQKVFLSFLSDAYQPFEERMLITRQVLQIFAQHNIKPIILTKNKLVIRDFDLIKKCGGEVGVTLTYLNPDFLHFEPNCSTPQERIEVLMQAKKAGIKTWVSLEPIIDKDEVIKIIEATAPYTDFYKVGKWNHAEEAKLFNWSEIAVAVTNKLKELGKDYLLKKEFEAFLK